MTKFLPSIFKVGFLSIFILGFSQFANAQVMVQEGFESATFPPTGWTKINNSTTGGKDWAISPGTFTDPPYTANTGTGCMVYEYIGSSPADAWMISPVLAMTLGSITISLFPIELDQQLILKK